jgi:hypothetical protein
VEDNAPPDHGLWGDLLNQCGGILDELDQQSQLYSSFDMHWGREIGTDTFNHGAWEATWSAAENVLPGPSRGIRALNRWLRFTDEAADTYELYEAYQSIPQDQTSTPSPQNQPLFFLPPVFFPIGGTAIPVGGGAIPM